METEQITEVVPVCGSCSAPIKDGDRFCGECGKEIAPEVSEDALPEDALTQVAPALIFYFVNLLLFAVYKLTPVFGDDFEGVVIVSIIDIVLVTGFSLYFGKSLLPLYRFTNVRIHLVGLTIALAVVAALVVNVLAEFINISLYEETGFETAFTDETNYPFLWATLLVCVQPAIFEEVTFRGFLYNNISRVTSTTGAILISSFMFGFLHLAFISLLWLVPLGLVAAWLRSKYNTLWYGMIAHFCYNFTIVVVETLQRAEELPF